jgi:ArsR family transcriptional regulator
LAEQVPELYGYGQDFLVGQNQINYYASLFKIFGDGNRQKLLYLLREGEKCVSDLLPYFDILQPTVSTHLLILEEAGILKVRRWGRKRMYSVSNPKIYDLLDNFVHNLKEHLST